MAAESGGLFYSGLRILRAKYSFMNKLYFFPRLALGLAHTNGGSVLFELGHRAIRDAFRRARTREDPWPPACQRVDCPPDVNERREVPRVVSKIARSDSHDSYASFQNYLLKVTQDLVESKAENRTETSQGPADRHTCPDDFTLGAGHADHLPMTPPGQTAPPDDVRLRIFKSWGFNRTMSSPRIVRNAGIVDPADDPFQGDAQGSTCFVDGLGPENVSQSSCHAFPNLSLVSSPGTPPTTPSYGPMVRRRNGRRPAQVSMRIKTQDQAREPNAQRNFSNVAHVNPSIDDNSDVPPRSSQQRHENQKVAGRDGVIEQPYQHGTNVFNPFHGTRNETDHTAIPTSAELQGEAQGQGRVMEKPAAQRKRNDWLTNLFPPQRWGAGSSRTVLRPLRKTRLYQCRAASPAVTQSYKILGIASQSVGGTQDVACQSDALADTLATWSNQPVVNDRAGIYHSPSIERIDGEGTSGRAALSAPSLTCQEILDPDNGLEPENSADRGPTSQIQVSSPNPVPMDNEQPRAQPEASVTRPQPPLTSFVRQRGCDRAPIFPIPPLGSNNVFLEPLPILSKSSPAERRGP